LDIKAKRVYDAVSDEDGLRVLIDRLWPRGMTKDRLRADVWMKGLAPSTELRKWSRKEAQNWGEFTRRYFHELDQNQDGVAELMQATRGGRVTLLYASKDTERNHAVALIEYLTGPTESVTGG
jgi:uncharacterized protein YeaO (DUF488 family)